MSSRRRWFRVHQAVGLAVVALFVLSAVTGSILVFRAQLRDPLPTVEPVEQRVSLDAIVAAAEAETAAPATDVQIPEEPDQPFVVWVDDDAETEVYLRGDGHIVGRRSGREGVLRWLFRLHTGEAFEPLGTPLTLATGLGLMLMAGSGLWMLWLRRRARRRSAPARVAAPAAATEPADHG